MVDISSEIARAVSAVGQPHLDRIKALGVSSEAIGALGHYQAPFGSARISIMGDGLYELHDRGMPAVLVPVYENGGPVDIVAFRTENPSAWYWRLGQGWCLGLEQLDPAARDDPIMVFETPLDWLRAAGQGLCILDWSAPDCEVERLRDARGFAAASHSLAAQLTKIMSRPRKLPQISLIGGQNEQAA